MKEIILEIVKSPLLFFIVLGLGFFLLAALGSWPGSQSVPMELGWRLGLGIAGLILAIGSAIPFWRQLSSKSPFSIEGTYYAEGKREYVNTITLVSDNIYRIKSHSWDGVGFVQGDFYYGIYKYSDSPDCATPGYWGAHMADIRSHDLPVFTIELSDKFKAIGGKEPVRWEKAK